ncbi:MAG TPA: hypothetical protein VFQ80_15105, partial [Thermomicrobiales bacterium]|nr:hypothetical protein [Thermomicrobiales bacterium]
QDAIWCGRHADAARRDVADRAASAAAEASAADGGIAARLARAAAAPGLDEEIGALRETLRRVLRDDAADPLKAALAVARLAAVAVQAAKARQTLASTNIGPLQTLLEEAAALADEAAKGRGDERSAGGADEAGRTAGDAGPGVDLRGGDAADGGRTAG